MFPATEARVRDEVARLGGQGHRWVVVEAALLLEAKWDVWVRGVRCSLSDMDPSSFMHTGLTCLHAYVIHPQMDEVWCMAVPPATAVARVMQRNALSAEAAERRVRSQMSNAERAARAAVVVDSSGPKRETAAKLTEAAAALRRRVLEEYGFDLLVGEGRDGGPERQEP